jgi:hypothetical protein
MTHLPKARLGTDAAHAITADATEFGNHMRQGGWRLGLLVARNVAVAPGRVAPETLLPKVNATEFARRAGTSNDRVLRHLAAWERAASAGLVPSSRTLNPGSNVDLDVERLPAWAPIYNAQQRPQPRPARNTPPPAPVATRRADPPIPEPEQVRPEPTDDAVVSRHLEAAAQTMRHQLEGIRANDRIRNPDDRSAARSQEWTEDVRYAVNALMGHTRRLFDAARDEEWDNTTARRRTAQDLVGISKQLAMIADIALDPAKGSVTDNDLQALLNS